MANKIEVTTEEYKRIKSNVLEGKLVNRMDISVNELNIKDLETIVIQGNEVSLAPEAMKGLSKSLGVTKAFIKVLDNAYEGQGNELLKLIVKAIKGKQSKVVTLVYNRGLNEITNIYPADSKIISDNAYFEALESLINNTPGSHLRNILVKPNGDISCIIANPKMEFDFMNFKEEVFTAGMTLDLTSSDMKSSFFTERMWCANGCTTTTKLMTNSVSTGSEVPSFLHAILTPEYHLSNINEFRKRLSRCYYTTASLAEVLNTDKRLRYVLGSAADELLKEMSSVHLQMEFGEDYLNQKDVHKFLRTDLSLWDLVNEITAISSRIEQESLIVEERANVALQVAGGDLMFTVPDLGPNNIRQIY